MSSSFLRINFVVRFMHLYIGCTALILFGAHGAGARFRTLAA